MFSGSSANISALRSFRVLRPLRTISGIEGLRVIVGALISSMPLLRDAMLVILFFFIIMAIGGGQLFSGSLKNRCIELETGFQLADESSSYCGGANICPDGYICGKSNQTPNRGITNFDDTLHSLLVVFEAVTLQGWSTVHLALWKCVGSYVIAYFVPIVFIGAFFLMNLTIAVIKSKFSEEQMQKKQGKTKRKKRQKQNYIDSDDDDKKVKQEGEQNEKSKQLTQEQKNQADNKKRIEFLLKRLDVTLHQKAVHDRLTPRNDLINSPARILGSKSLSKTRIISNQQLNNTDTFDNGVSFQNKKLQRVQTLKIQNKHAFFNLYGYDNLKRMRQESLNSQEQVKETSKIISRKQINKKNIKANNPMNRFNQNRRNSQFVMHGGRQSILEETIKEADEEYNDVTRLHDEDEKIDASPRQNKLNQKIDDEILKDDQIKDIIKTKKSNQKINGLLPINRQVSKCSNKKINQKQDKKTNQQQRNIGNHQLYNNLEKNFSIDKQKNQPSLDKKQNNNNKDEELKKTNSKLIMSGMVKIQRVTCSQSRLQNNVNNSPIRFDGHLSQEEEIQQKIKDEKLDQERKKAAYQKIKDNFKFLDFLDHEGFTGGDELSDNLLKSDSLLNESYNKSEFADINISQFFIEKNDRNKQNQNQNQQNIENRFEENKEEYQDYLYNYDKSSNQNQDFNSLNESKREIKHNSYKNDLNNRLSEEEKQSGINEKIYDQEQQYNSESILNKDLSNEQNNNANLQRILKSHTLKIKSPRETDIINHFNQRINIQNRDINDINKKTIQTNVTIQQEQVNRQSKREEAQSKLQRLQTHFVKHDDYNYQGDYDEDYEEENIEQILQTNQKLQKSQENKGEIKTPSEKKKKKKKVPIKERAKVFFQRLKFKNSNKKEIQKFKAEIKNSSNQKRQTTIMDTQKDLKIKQIGKSKTDVESYVKSQKSIKQSSYKKSKLITLRDKFLERKKQEQEIEWEQFKTRELLIQKRRNKFFYHSIVNLGKTKQQIQKEKLQQLEKKRMIKLSMGFELSQKIMSKPNFNKRILMRSGTVDYNQTKQFNNENLEINKPSKTTQGGEQKQITIQNTIKTANKQQDQQSENEKQLLQSQTINSKFIRFKQKTLDKNYQTNRFDLTDKNILIKSQNTKGLLNFQDYQQQFKEQMDMVTNQKQLATDEQEEVDMIKIFQTKKKKVFQFKLNLYYFLQIMLNEKKFFYSSIDDIFENRVEGQIVEQHCVLNKEALIDEETKEQKDQKMQDRQNEEKKMTASKIKGYQKKVIYRQKGNLDELIINDDQNQDGDLDNNEALKNLEKSYNINHKSNIYVTGTLSVVINDTRTINQKIMANHFFQNINGNKSRDQSKMPIINGENNSININPMLQSGITISKDVKGSSSGIDEISYISNGEKMQQLSSITNPNTINGQFQPNSAQIYKRKRSNNLSPQKTQTMRRMQTLKRQSTNLNPYKSQMSMNSNKQGKNYNQQFQQMNQAYNEKQLLFQLNKEMKKSKIFQSTNFHNLPQKRKTMKSKNPSQLVPTLDLKNNQQQQQPEEIEDDQQSEEEFKNAYQLLGNDFFIEREIECQEEVKKAKEQAIIHQKDYIEWSGQDVIQRLDPYKMRLGISSLNRLRVLPKGIHRYIKRFRIMVRMLVRNDFYENFFIACVIFNTVILSMDHYQIDPDTSYSLSQFNFAFTIIFTIEMGLKIIAIGIMKYVKDKMNYLDGAVVLLSLIEVMISSGGGALSAFRTVRIFRTFRVLRVARILKSMKSMMNILAVIQNSISSFIYLTILMFLFVFIYALLGMQIYGGNFNFKTGIPRQNFDTFDSAFLTSFMILTLEKWQNVFYNAMAGGINFFINILYFVSWIFIGNFMLLHFFLAIMLDSFQQIDQAENLTPDQIIQKNKQQQEELEKKEGQDLILAVQMMDCASSMNQQNSKKSLILKKKQKKKKKKNLASQSMVSNILDESIEIDLETLLTKKEQIKEKPLFENVECQKSIYIFDQSYKIRIILFKIVNNTKFEYGIMVFIILSTTKLILDTYIQDLPETSFISILSSKLDYVFTVVFAVESLIKTISFGFIQDKGSYLRESWSQLDFFIVITSLIDAVLTNVNLPIIKILRLLRILRPLRFISHNSSMKTVVVALLQSLFSIFNVTIILSLVYLMFAILGVNLFSGKFQYCSIDKYNLSTKSLCLDNRGQWMTYNSNFDSVPNAMMSLFIAATRKGWIEIMTNSVDAAGEAIGPVKNYSLIAAYFFILFLLIGSFFMMNLFVGVLFMNFEAAQREEKESSLLTENQSKWVDMMNLIVQTKPEIIKIPKNRFSEWAYAFTKPETPFDILVMVVIILNMFQMAISYEGQSDQYTNALQIINYIFTSVFFLECFLKLVGQSTAYFSSNWNRFDFFVVCASLIDIIMSTLSTSSISFLKVGPQLLRVLRILRLSRLFRLLNKYRGLQALIQTITFSMPSLLNVLALLVLVLFIFSVLGVFMFRSVTEGVIINEYLNFKNFGQALILLFKMSTGEDWDVVMYDLMNTSKTCVPNMTCGSNLAPLYFLSFNMICNYVMLNLFILVIIQQFELYYLVDDNILQRFRDDLANYKQIWTIFSRDYEGTRIRSIDLVPFFKNLKGSLGMGKEKDAHILRNIVKMNIVSDEYGFVYFNELLFKSMKRIYAEERSKNRILIDHELKALESLQKIKEKLLQKYRHIDKVKVVTVNPFLTIMYKSMSFKAWVKLFKQNLTKRKEEQEFQLERDSSDDEGISKYYDQYEYLTEQDVSVDEDDYIDEQEEENEDDESCSYQNSDEQDQEFGSHERGEDNYSSIQGSKDGTERVAVAGLEIDENMPSRKGSINRGFTIKLKKTKKLKDSHENNENNAKRSMRSAKHKHQKSNPRVQNMDEDQSNSVIQNYEQIGEVKMHTLNISDSIESSKQ